MPTKDAAGASPQASARAQRVFRRGGPRWASRLVIGTAGAVLLAHPALAQHYNFKYGDLRMDLSAVFDTEFNDNISQSGVDPAPDIILKPGVLLRSDYRFSSVNNVSLVLGASYDKYLNNPQLDSSRNFATISPESELAFHVLVGDATIKVFDRFAYTIEPNDAIAVNPATGEVITNILDYARFNNTAGVTVDYNMNRLIPYFQFTRDDVLPQSNQFDFTQRYTYTATPGFRYLFSPTLIGGFFGSYAYNDYLVPYQNDSQSFSFGPTLQWQPLESVFISTRVYYTKFMFEQTGTNRDTSQPQTIDGEISIGHQLTALYSHQITYGRSSPYGFIANTTDVDRVSYSFDWRAFTRTTLRGGVRMEHAEDSGGILPERSDRYGFSIGFSYELGPKLTAGVDYDYSKKFSNIPQRTFDRNRVVLSLRYDF